MRYKESETTEFKKYTSEVKESVIAVDAILNKHGKALVFKLELETRRKRYFEIRFR